MQIYSRVMQSLFLYNMVQYCLFMWCGNCAMLFVLFIIWKWSH